MSLCFRTPIAPYELVPQRFECFALAQGRIRRRKLPFRPFWPKQSRVRPFPVDFLRHVSHRTVYFHPIGSHRCAGYPVGTGSIVIFRSMPANSCRVR